MISSLHWEPNIRTIPYVGENPSSGPVKIGNNWAGVFIRGDVAFDLANQLKLVADQQSSPVMAEAILRLALRLEQCREPNG